MANYTVVGKSLPRLDAPEKATGQAKYSGDVILPGLLWGKILRSPHTHARILRIDTSQAERLPGVKAVITARDASQGRAGFSIEDEPIFARDKALYVGDRVAAVAAVDEETAQEALDLIRVDYDLLPPVLDPVAAMAPEAPLLHDDLSAYRARWAAVRFGNVCSHTTIRKGDTERAFAEADVIVEDTFRTATVHHSYIEPKAAVASVDASAKLTVWFSSQTPFGVRTELAHLLGLPQSKIRVVSTHVGGGFGGKEGAFEAAVASLLALRSGRPVKLILTREEDFESTTPRHPSLVWLKVGAKQDGTLVAGEAKVVVGAGAYAGFGPHATGNLTRLLFAPYHIPNLKADGYAVHTNTMPKGAMRAPGAPQAAFAMESLMDMLAEKLGMDPLVLRLKNAVADGDTSATGQVYERIGLRHTLERIRDEAGWGEKPSGKNRGLGVAVGAWHTGGMSGSCTVKINPDGTIGVNCGSVDIGQGSTTLVAQVIAEELGVLLEDITMVTADTETTPYDTLTAGSSVTYRMGNAARKAAREAKERMLRLAAERLEANVEDLEARERRIYVRGSPERSIGIREVAALTNSRGEGPIQGQGSFIGRAPAYDPNIAKGFPLGGAVIWPTFATQLAEVEVDEGTGQVRLMRLANAQDVGFAINPMGVQGQIEGGSAMGVGQALTEAYVYDNGHVKNPSFLDYKIPTALDISKTESMLVEVPAADGPFGAKGVGESPIIPTPAAIANAIYNAVGVRIKELPITPEKVRRALAEKRAAAGAKA